MPLPIICKQCGKTAYFPPSEVDGRCFCSMKCRRRYQSVTLICEQCGVAFSVPRSWSKRRFCNKKCSSDYFRGEQGPDGSARTLDHSTGYYILVWRHPYRRTSEHRYMMEKKLSRNLRRSEIVHHKNGICTDNRIENLEIINGVGQHVKMHADRKRDGVPS